MTDLTTICAWCTRALVDGEWVYTTHVSGFTTHGICPRCETTLSGASRSVGQESASAELPRAISGSTGQNQSAPVRPSGLRCVPGECPDCVAWGLSVPGKVRCERNGKLSEGMHGWFSTSLGAACMVKAEQLGFDLTEDDAE